MFFPSFSFPNSYEFYVIVVIKKKNTQNSEVKLYRQENVICLAYEKLKTQSVLWV